MAVAFDQSKDQDKFLVGMGFKKHVIEYPFGTIPCFETPSGRFCRVDHFSNVYVIEWASNWEEARNSAFDDGYDVPDDLPEAELIQQVQEAIRKDMR